MFILDGMIGQGQAAQPNFPSYPNGRPPVPVQRTQVPSAHSRVPSTAAPQNMVSRPPTAFQTPSTRFFAPGMMASGNWDRTRTPLPSVNTSNVSSEHNTRTPFVPGSRT